MYVHSNPDRKNDHLAQPDIEVFHSTEYADGDLELDEGYYWWSCLPGCLPDGDPIGPFKTGGEAITNARG